MLKRLALIGAFLLASLPAHGQQSVDTSHILRCTNPTTVKVTDYLLVTRNNVTCNGQYTLASVPIATSSSNGIMHPDNTTLQVAVDGTLSQIAAPDATTIGSVTTANPYIAAAPTSGFYTPSANIVGVELGGAKAMQWNTLSAGVDYIDIVPGKSGTHPKLRVNGATANQGLDLTATGTGTISVNGMIVASTGTVTTGTWNGSVIGSAYVAGAYTGITGLGTVTTGTWNGAPVGIAYGGLGLSTTPATGKILVGNAGAYMLATLTGANGLVVTTSTGNSTVTLTPVASSVSVNTGVANQAAYYSATSTLSGAPWLTLTTSLVSVAGNFTATGTGQFLGGIKGTTTGDNACSGCVGEYVSSSVAQGSAVALTSGAARNVTSVVLTPGDWSISGSVIYDVAGTTVSSAFWAAANTTSGTLPTAPNGGAYTQVNPSSTAGFASTLPFATARYSLSATTTVYLIADSLFATSTSAAYGFIGARRER